MDTPNSASPLPTVEVPIRTDGSAYLVPDAGPAFPNPRDPQTDIGHCGMSLLDWFAGQAIVGVLAAEQDCAGFSSLEKVAEFAYKLSDAMLAERAKRGGKA